MKTAKAIGYVLAVGSLGIVLMGCQTKEITSFVETLEPTWATVEIREDLKYDKTWPSLVDSLVKKFDIEVMSKEDGYIRTGWMYSWTGQVKDNYRVRVTAKFSPDRTKVEVKSEAEYGGRGKWVAGFDTRLLETLKTDIMGNMGRTTR